MVRANRVVMVFVLPEEVFEVPFSEDREMVEAFLLATLDEPLRVGVQVG